MQGGDQFEQDLVRYRMIDSVHEGTFKPLFVDNAKDDNHARRVHAISA